MKLKALLILLFFLIFLPGNILLVGAESEPDELYTCVAANRGKNCEVVDPGVVGSCIGRADGTLECVPSPICIPSRCFNDYEADFNCINRKLLNPSADCCENRCAGETPVEEPEEFEPLFEFFGYSLVIRGPHQLPVLINLVITTFLGFVSVYAFIFGVYTAGYVRTRTTDAEVIAGINRRLTTLIIGFVLAWGFIVIIQVVANILGLGDLSSLELVGDTGGSTITVE